MLTSGRAGNGSRSRLRSSSSSSRSRPCPPRSRPCPPRRGMTIGAEGAAVAWEFNQSDLKLNMNSIRVRDGFLFRRRPPQKRDLSQETVLVKYYISCYNKLWPAETTTRRPTRRRLQLPSSNNPDTTTQGSSKTTSNCSENAVTNKARYNNAGQLATNQKIQRQCSDQIQNAVITKNNIKATQASIIEKRLNWARCMHVAFDLKDVPSPRGVLYDKRKAETKLK